MILLGSRALALRMPSALHRSPLDFDWCSTKEEFDEWFLLNQTKVNATKVYPELNGKKYIVEGDVNCEFDIITPGSSNEMLLDIVKNDPETIDTSFGLIPSFDLLFTIKQSHRYKKFGSAGNHFYKTALDWHMMLAHGAKVRPEYQEFLSLREKETYTNKLPKLNMSKSEFFDESNGIKQVFDHDSVHQAVAIFDRPAYTYYLRDGSPVLTDNAKFFSVSQEIRIAGVLEECFTLAIERSLECPEYKGTWTSDQAFRFALSKVCTSITSGKFREFAFLHLFEVLKEYKDHHQNYYDRFLEAIKNRRVKRLI